MLILNNHSGSQEQCVSYILSRKHGEYTEYDVKKITDSYFSIGTITGIDAFMAIAQMIHETDSLNSWWAARPRRNPAGIGVTGRTSQEAPQRGKWARKGNVYLEGVSFDTWASGAVPAHLGRLLAYCMKDSAANDAQRAIIWQAMQVRTLPARLRGVALEWKDLNGKWAVPGKTYGQTIERLAERMRNQ